jgi:putative exosortase-associated protein (TIGR04073 family)
MMRRWLLIGVLVLVAIAGVVSIGQAGEPDPAEQQAPLPELIAVKLLRGVANMLTGWAELPKQVHHLWVHEGWVSGLTRGTIDGLGMLIARTLAGAYETVSFPLPVPPSYRPLLEPPYVWQAEAPPESNAAASKSP